MKKIFLLLVGIGLFAFATPTSALVPTGMTIVAGKVTHNNQAVSGANITVVCNTHSQNTTTNSNGDYGVTYDPADCPDGKVATVVASKNGMGGTNSGTVGATGAINLNIAIVNVSIPEFGVITGFAGMAAAGGLFIYTRRRQGAKIEQA
jgi:hypothetical protein